MPAFPRSFLRLTLVVAAPLLLSATVLAQPVKGRGATFPAKVYSTWAKAFAKALFALSADGSSSEPPGVQTCASGPGIWAQMESEMRARQWVRWLGQIQMLDARQREQLRAELHDRQSVDDVTAVLEQRLASAPVCPRCSHEKCVRNGHADGLQRYKCCGCGRSFNALSGTPLAHLRLRAKWTQQAQALQEGWSVRHAAARLGVHRTTAFRWRHRFLSQPCQQRPAALGGIVEADETYVLESYKGQPRQLRKQAARPSRHRGGRAGKRGLSGEQIPVLVLRERSGRTSDFVLPAPADKNDVKDRLRQALADDAVLCTDTSATLRAAAREAGLEHQAVNVSRGERTRGAWHIQNANAYHSRFKTWMRRFNGVATSYLAHYTGWFRALDRLAQAADANPLSMLAFSAGNANVSR